MLITSVSLPANLAKLWRRKQSRILRFMSAGLRAEVRRGRMRRGVKRRYNRGQGAFDIVTTRFSAEQYDTLHTAAAGLRVSVSWLIFKLILLWKNTRKKRKVKIRATNYLLVLHQWSENLVSYTEKIRFGRRIILPP